MKSFNQLVNEVSLAWNEVDSLKKKAKSLTDQWVSEPDLLTRRDKHRKLEGEIIATETELLNWKLTAYMLKNNARIAIFHEAMPVLLDILAKYKGKPYGTKTRDKIAAELVERTGFRAYIGLKYSQTEINIYPMIGNSNAYSITVGLKMDSATKEIPRLLVDNKIQLQPLEAFEIWYIKREYIEDIPAAIAEMRSLHETAFKLRMELRNACSAFNRYAVDGIDQLDDYKPIYSTITTSSV